MAYTDFVHLHTHSEYSFLDGANKVDALIELTKSFGLPALAITDHGNMFGAMEFFKKANKAGIKPIIGNEMYVSVGHRKDKKSIPGRKHYHHLIVLAKNREGYQNLMRLTSLSYQEGFYYKPRVDKELLRTYSKGLVGMTACIGGEIPQKILSGHLDEARDIVKDYQSIFGEDFYLEFQDHGLPEQKKVNTEMFNIMEELGLKGVLTNDCHYLKKEYFEAHKALICIGIKKNLSENHGLKYTTEHFYKNGDEMWAVYPEKPSLLSTTVEIAEKCDLKLDNKLVLPTFELPKEFLSDDDYLQHLSFGGLEKRIGKLSLEYESRLKSELKIIKDMGFSSYILIVYDIVHAARQRNIPVGPGRGSVGGSLVAYAIAITDVDPIKYDLIFERFLNQDRVSMPDIDIDFSDLGREEIIRYVVDKYGRDCVCQIVTLSTMGTKSVLRDVARVMEIPLQVADKASKLVPVDLRQKMTLERALKENKELTEIKKSSAQYENWFKTSSILEGLTRQAGVHAAGVIIAPKPVYHYSPICFQPGKKEVMTQYDKKYSEEAGLLKIDFLGLRNLSTIDYALKMIKENHGVEIDLQKLDYLDEKTYALFSRGDTIGIFQFESTGMQDYLRKLKPERIEDLIAMNALYRPGPMKNIDKFIRCKHGEEKVAHYHPDLEPVLSETYGVIVYQEQVMRIAQIMGGFSLGEADVLRDAMGKKKEKEMAKQKAVFIERARKKGHTKKLAEQIAALLSEFAQYGFNKSHAAAYSILAFQTAYLKANYPYEFFAALLTSESGNTDGIVKLVHECKRLQIRLLPPDVNVSQKSFTVHKREIVFGLGAIKNVGDGAIESIFKARAELGTLNNIYELCCYVDLSLANSRVLESLIKAGALDSLTGTRAQNMASLDMARRFGQKYLEEKESLQTSLFGGKDDDKQNGMPYPALSDTPPWTGNELAIKEKEVMGFYISGHHPLERYEDELKYFATFKLSADDKAKLKDGDEKIIGGIVSKVRKRIDKKNRTYAFVTLEDFYGEIEIAFWSNVWEIEQEKLLEDKMVLVSSRFKKDEQQIRVEGRKVLDLSEARDTLTQSVHVRLKTDGLTKKEIQDFYESCVKHRGQKPLVIHVLNRSGKHVDIKSGSLRINHNKKALEGLRQVLGAENVWLSRAVV